MVAYRLNTQNPLRQLRSEMDRLFTDLFPAAGPFVSAPARGFPAVNVWENANEWTCEAELPGVLKEDLEIAVVGNELTIKGERKEFNPEGATFHRRERGTGAFQRSLRLPGDVDADQVQANLVDGVLRIRLPKAAAVKPRKIEVSVGKS